MVIYVYENAVLVGVMETADGGAMLQSEVIVTTFTSLLAFCCTNKDVTYLKDFMWRVRSNEDPYTL